MRVGEMEESHLLSAIAMVERAQDWRKIWLPRLYMELAARRCSVPMRLPVSPITGEPHMRIDPDPEQIVRMGAKAARQWSSIRGLVEKLVTDRVAAVLESQTSTSREGKSRSKRPKAKRSKTPRGTSLSGTSSSPRTKAPPRKRRGK